MMDVVKKVSTKYRNITISGLPGAGSTTLAKVLSEKLGWTYHSGGDFMRQYAIKNGYFDPKITAHHLATAYPEDFDRKVDYEMRENLTSKRGCIYESWLSGFLAQGVPDVLKILVYCSDDAVRVDRIANRDAISIAEAKEHIFTRESKNLEKWQHMYGHEWDEWVAKPKGLKKGESIYFWRRELYDLVIDTFGHGKDETLKIAFDKIAEH
jgi:cytidylate kinase